MTERSQTIVSYEEWEAAITSHREEEKRLMHAKDRLAEKRRGLPRLRVTEDYLFRSNTSELNLTALFDGRRQLIVYHHMLKPADPAPCSGCSMFADSLPNLAHLHARETSLAMVSEAPIAEISAFQNRMGWDIPWVESLGEFNADMGIRGGFGVNVFLRKGDGIYRTYATSGRGVEDLGSVWGLLDVTAFGRQESWQVAPEGTPQSAPYVWWRLHDEYQRAAEDRL